MQVYTYMEFQDNHTERVSAVDIPSYSMHASRHTKILRDTSSWAQQLQAYGWSFPMQLKYWQTASQHTASVGHHGTQNYTLQHVP